MTRAEHIADAILRHMAGSVFASWRQKFLEHLARENAKDAAVVRKLIHGKVKS